MTTEQKISDVSLAIFRYFEKKHRLHTYGNFKPDKNNVLYSVDDTAATADIIRPLIHGAWQLIDTAPKDGTRILTYRLGIKRTMKSATVHLVVLSSWQLSNNSRHYPGWAGWKDTNQKFEREMYWPTHWTHLPVPPQ